MPVLLIRHVDLLHCFREFCFFVHSFYINTQSLFVCVSLANALRRIWCVSQPPTTQLD